uniref:HNH nuclease domain-containing protein n=1 Tax=viral metagenome TaxID=1070528 RepID=A0A6M3KY62_9ZZZZ
MKKKYYCKDCHKNKISYITFKYGKGRCLHCCRLGVRNVNFGGNFSKKHIINLSNSQKIRLSNPKNNPMYGKHHTEETKQQISISKILKKVHKGKNNSNYKHGKCGKKYYCEICNKTLSGYRSNLCHSCSTKKRFLNPKNHPSYIDGRSFEDYPKEFNQFLRNRIRERDNYTCQNCSMTEEEHLIIYGRNLEVHHIDYNRKNCKEDNLITLCKQCNIRANKNRDYWKEIYGRKAYSF